MDELERAVKLKEIVCVRESIRHWTDDIITNFVKRKRMCSDYRHWSDGTVVTDSSAACPLCKEFYAPSQTFTPCGRCPYKKHFGFTCDSKEPMGHWQTWAKYKTLRCAESMRNALIEVLRSLETKFYLSDSNKENKKVREEMKGTNMKFNVYQENDGYVYSVGIGSDADENMGNTTERFTYLGTEERNIIPPMKEVVKEEPAKVINRSNSGKLHIAADVPADAYDYKLTYKIKEPV